MKYFSINYAIYKIGRSGFPQAQHSELAPGKKVTDPDFVWRLRPDSVPEFDPYIGTLILQNGSARTDFISSAIISTGYVCNEKVISILKEHKPGDTRFYKLGVKHKTILYDNYFLMHCLNNYASQVDYQNSDFKRIRFENNKKVEESYPVKDLNEVLETRIKLSKSTDYSDWRHIEPFVIKFKENFEPSHDIFTIWGATYKTFVSERLREAFDKFKITGIQYDFDIENIIFQ